MRCPSSTASDATPPHPDARDALVRKLVEALTNLADVFHEGRAQAATSGDGGYVQSVIDAAEEVLSKVSDEMKEDPQ